MPYVITEACINIKDKACVDVCPVDCIYEGPDQLFIKPDECIDCGACEPEKVHRAEQGSLRGTEPAGAADAVTARVMLVEQATPADLAAIRSAYAHGRALQREIGSPLWPEFTDAAILAEINSGALHRVLDDDALVGVFSAVYDDEPIWAELELGAHIYLHRIARASSYPGRGLVDAVIAWALERAEELGREGLRMDTWASNRALIAYYEKRGFTFLGTRRIPTDSPLSEHYRGIELALLEHPLAH